MSTPLPLNETVSVTLNGSGAGTAKLGPNGPNEQWTPTSVSVICSTNTNESSCSIYVGPSAVPQYFKDRTVDGSSGDSTDRCNVLIRKNNFVWAVWSGGDAGTTATLNVDGTKVI